LANAYVIFYLVERDRIVIVRVLHGRRDIDAEFQR
jgi:plasmid stabilization system protein ParE